MATNILSTVNDVARLAKLTADANDANAIRELDLAAKKELISIAAAINTAAAKGFSKITYKFSGAINSLTGLNLEYAIDLIEADLTSAEYEFEQKKTGNKVTGYDISWTTHIANFNELVDALVNNDRVVLALTSDITRSEPLSVPAGKTLIVDLGANIVNESNDTTFIADGGTIVLRGTGSVMGAGRAAVADNGGKIIIESGNYTTTSAGQIVSSTRGSEVIINGGEFNGQEFAAMAFYGSKLEINGGEFTTIDNCVVGTNGTVVDKNGNPDDQGHNIITIKNAVLNGGISSNGYAACGIYAANNDTITIEDTVINIHNGCGICQRAGNVIVKSGVEINLTADDGFTGGWVGDKKRVVGLDGIAYLPADNYPGAAGGMSLTVEDGVTINAIDHAIFLDPANADGVKVSLMGNYTPAYPEDEIVDPVVANEGSEPTDINPEE